ERAAGAAAAQGRAGHARVLRGLARSLRAEGDEDERLRLALDPELGPLVEGAFERRAVSNLPHPLAVRVEPAESAVFAWCALAEPDPLAPSVLERLPRVAALGFDAVVLPGAGLFENDAPGGDA